jgi:hypothetical protein
MLSKENYARIAAILGGNFACESSEGKGAIFVTTLSLADYFAADNPGFRRDKFYAAVFGEDNLDLVRPKLRPESKV